MATDMIKILQGRAVSYTNRVRWVRPNYIFSSCKFCLVYMCPKNYESWLAV